MTFPSQTLRRWNAKFHIYLGLYLLLSTWIFAASGLLLNHSAWRFAQFWDQRKETWTTNVLERIPEGADIARARQIMEQLHLTGEIEWTDSRRSGTALNFRVERPGQILDLKTDASTRQAVVHEIRFNSWGIIRTLHTFTGVRSEGSQRDWVLTRIWSFSMDALAVGLIVLVVTGLVLGWQAADRRGAAIALAIGCVVCGFFVYGLRFL